MAGSAGTNVASLLDCNDCSSCLQPLFGDYWGLFGVGGVGAWESNYGPERPREHDPGFGCLLFEYSDPRARILQTMVSAIPLPLALEQCVGSSYLFGL